MYRTRYHKRLYLTCTISGTWYLVLLLYRTRYHRSCRSGAPITAARAPPWRDAPPRYRLLSPCLHSSRRRWLSQSHGREFCKKTTAVIRRRIYIRVWFFVKKRKKMKNTTKKHQLVCRRLLQIRQLWVRQIEWLILNFGRHQSVARKLKYPGIWWQGPRNQSRVSRAALLIIYLKKN